MKKIFIAILLIYFSTNLNAQKPALPEFNNKPSYYNFKNNKLTDLEKSQYNILAKAKNPFKAEGGFFLNGASSPVKISKQQELKFIIKVTEGTDPSSVVDLVKFEIKDDKRIFITTKTKITKTSTSFEKINFAVEKIKEGYYYLLVKDLNAGEYFFGASDFMFAFSIE